MSTIPVLQKSLIDQWAYDTYVAVLEKFEFLGHEPCRVIVLKSLLMDSPKGLGSLDWVVHNHLQRRMDDGRMSHGKLHKRLVSAASIPAETAGRARHPLRDLGLAVLYKRSRALSAIKFHLDHGVDI